MKTILNSAGLQVAAGGSPAPIPEWCKFLVDLGIAVAMDHCAGNRTVVGLVLPHRAYAAPFAVLGVVAYRSRIPTSTASPQDYFNTLKALPIGQPVKLLLNGKRLTGVIKGATEDHLSIMTESGTPGRSGALLRFVYPEDAADVEVLPLQETALPASQNGRAFVQNQDFIQRLIPGIDIADFAGRSRTECGIIGPSSGLRAEINEMTMMLAERSKIFSASLQDVIRVRGFAGESMAYRSVAVSADKPTAPQVPDSNPNTVIIFNSALAYKRWQGAFPNHSCIVLLDSAESGFADAAAALNQEYLLRNADAVPLFMMPPPPIGIEAVVFRTITR